MARNRRQSEPDPPGLPTVPAAKGVELIERQIEAGSALVNGLVTNDSYQSWESTTSTYLEMSFGARHPKIEEFLHYGKFGSFPTNASETWWVAKRKNNIQGQLTLLRGFQDVLRTQMELDAPAQAVRSAQAVPSERPNSQSNEVFVVHGHDTALQQSVARFLEKLGLKAVILDEQPNQGRTIFQKFSDHSDVRFAIVLFTGDDIGGKKGTPPERLLPRARQNVILEFGYFLAKLGPAAVCALYEPGVELPSDVSGMLYVPVESGPGWKLKLCLEMKAAGIDVDMNRIS